MRKVKLSNGKEYTIESLSAKEVRDFRDGKLDFIDETFFFADKAGVKDKDLADVTFIELQDVKKACIAETFGIEPEVKN